MCELCVVFSNKRGTASPDPRYSREPSLFSSITQEDLLFNHIAGLLYFLIGFGVRDLMKDSKDKVPFYFISLSCVSFIA